MKLTKNNYFSPKASQFYMSTSQFKQFSKCEAAAVAQLNGEWQPEKSEALLLGSYVDETLTGTPKSLKKFIDNNPDLFSSRGTTKGQLKSNFIHADEAVRLIRNQQKMMYYLSGKHQKIMTGVIEGVPFKIKMDSYKPHKFIADLKYMASLRSPNLFTPMVKYWGYDIQGAIYQEVVYQNTGERLPFILVVGTKEKTPHFELGQINQNNLDEALNQVRINAPRYQLIKNKEINAERCNDYECDYCTTTKIITEPIDTDLFGLSASQLNFMKGNI